MRLLRQFSTTICVVANFIGSAGEGLPANPESAVEQPTADLELLQGTWEGFVVDGRMASDEPDLKTSNEPKPKAIDMEFLRTGVLGSPQVSQETVTITITGNSLHFHRDTNFWFETTFALPAGVDPKQLHATIKDCPPSQAESIGKVVGAIFKVEDGTLTLAAYDISEEPPKSFASAASRYVVQKVRPQKGDAESPPAK